MSSKTNTNNRRILVVDDEQAVRDHIKFILAKESRRHQKLDESAYAFFEGSMENLLTLQSAAFELVFADCGPAALDLVRQSLSVNQPFAAIFCDIRMPGWDGIQTVSEIKKIDERAEIIFVTAYSDYSIESIAEEVGVNFSYLFKPFSPDEIRQHATRAIYSWNRSREIERLIRTLASLRGRVEDIQALLVYFLNQICQLVGTESAAVFQTQRDGVVHFKLGVGEFSSPDGVPDNMIEAIHRDPDARSEYFCDGVCVIPMKEFGMTVAMADIRRLSGERRFLIREFVECVSQVLLENTRPELLMPVGQLENLRIA